MYYVDKYNLLDFNSYSDTCTDCYQRQNLQILINII